MDDGNGVAVVDQYTCSQSLVKGIVNSANNLMGALDNASAIHEMEEVHKGLIDRQKRVAALLDIVPRLHK